MAKVGFVSFSMGSFDYIMKAKGKKDALEEWLDEVCFGKMGVPIDISDAEIYNEEDNCLYVKGDCFVCPQKYRDYASYQDNLMKTSKAHNVDIEILVVRDSNLKHYIYEHDDSAPVDTYGDIDEELLELESLTDFKKWRI